MKDLWLRNMKKTGMNAHDFFGGGRREYNGIMNSQFSLPHGRDKYSLRRKSTKTYWAKQDKYFSGKEM